MKITHYIPIILLPVAFGCKKNADSSDNIRPKDTRESLYTESLDYKSFIGIAAVNPKKGIHVTRLLDDHGIPNLVEGSIVYGIRVQPKDQTRALDILIKDSIDNGNYLIRH